MKDLLSTTEAAKILGVNRVTVFNKIQSGELQASKVGRNYVVHREELKRYMSKSGDLSEKRKRELDQNIDRVIREYEETLKLLQHS
ncbi:MAG: helix-turn-helix domain-containing protein [bacterium]|nr:helix-turn-helix domain-containing protein [bacterium]